MTTNSQDQSQPPEGRSRRFSRGPVSMRWSLFRNVFVLVLLITAASIVTSGVTTRRTVKVLSRSLIQRTIVQMEMELDQFFRPMQSILNVTAIWAERGELDLVSPASVRHQLQPILDRFPPVSSVNSGTADGRGYMMLKTGTNWLGREVRREEWGSRARWSRWRGSEEIEDTWWEELNYDPRQRPWYRNAVAKFAEEEPRPATSGHMLHWTAPYNFFTSKKPGITASIAVEPPGQTRPVVVALDILLEDISQFTQDLAPSENGLVLIATEDGSVIGWPRGATMQNKQPSTNGLAAVLLEAGQSAAAAGVRAWQARGSPLDKPFQFTNQREGWWGGFQVVAMGENRNFWAGVMVPKRDFLVDVWRQRFYFLAIMLGALGIAAGMVMALSRKYSDPLRALVVHSKEIQNLNLSGKGLPASRIAEVATLNHAQERMRRALESFARYVPTDVVRELLRQGEAARLGGTTQTLTVMFSDIQGFTSVAESMSPEALTLHLADYFKILKEGLDRHHATIDKFIGDAVLAFWGAPVARSDHARQAVLAVLAVDRALATFNQATATQGTPTLPTRFGLATGPVVVGNIGAPDRLNYSVVGNTVNLASRVEGLNRFYGTNVLATESVVAAAGDGLVWRFMDRVIVKGQSNRVRIFELLGLEGTVPETRLRLKSVYEDALTAMQQRRFQEALDLLKEHGRPFPGVLSVKRLQERCQDFLSHPPPENWDTSIVFKEK